MHKTAPFGAYTLHTLEDAQGDNYLAFVPGFGSCVLELRLGGISLLDGYKTAVEMEANRWAKNTVLFPFPNRLSDGAYSWDGNSYQFPINEPISGTALHGFGQDKPMQAHQFSVREAEATAECRYKSKLMRFQCVYDLGYLPLQYEPCIHSKIMAVISVSPKKP